VHDAPAGHYDLLLVFKVDRLARSTGGLAKVLEELDAARVAFRSASEPFDTSTAAGRMMMQMLGVFAEFEREMIVERTRMGLARKAARGEWTGGTAPIGYRYDPDAQALVLKPLNAALVQRIFMLYVDRRLGSAAISGLLNDAGQLASRGRRWIPNRFLGVLRNPTYIGQLPFNGKRHRASHEPIIDCELFEQAQRLLEERSGSPRPWPRSMTAPSSRKPPNAQRRPGTPATLAAKPSWPAHGQPSWNGARPSIGTCGPSRPDGCPRRPARTALASSTERCGRWSPRSDPGSGTRNHTRPGDRRDADRRSAEGRACVRRWRSPAAQATPRRRAHGSSASRLAEADGNRTRLSRVAAHTGFEATCE
jgi:hypothetical protein